VPGAKGGWITVRDAVKKKPHKDIPKPGKFRVSASAEAEVKPEPKSDAKPAETQAPAAAPAAKEGA